MHQELFRKTIDWKFFNYLKDNLTKFEDEGNLFSININVEMNDREYLIVYLYNIKHSDYVDGDGDAGECVLQACELLWGNCDDDVNNGCETILAQDNNCGGCGVICPNPQQCLTVCDDTGATCFTSCQ